MLKLIFLILCVFAFNLLNGQSIRGTLLSFPDSAAIENAHIINISQHKMTISNLKGAFTIAGLHGDTIYISNINFQTRQFIIRDNLEIRIIMDPLNAELEEVLVSNLPATEAHFKNRVIEMPIIQENAHLPAGVTPGKPKGKVPKLYERETKLLYGGGGTGPGIGLPISFFTKKFSKRHKAKRDYYEAKAAVPTTIENTKKYNRELVTELTALEEEAIKDFMTFMKLSNEFIEISSEYEIACRILQEYKDYQKFLQTIKLEDM